MNRIKCLTILAEIDEKLCLIPVTSIDETHIYMALKTLQNKYMLDDEPLQAIALDKDAYDISTIQEMLRTSKDYSERLKYENR